MPQNEGSPLQLSHNSELLSNTLILLEKLKMLFSYIFL